MGRPKGSTRGECFVVKDHINMIDADVYAYTMTKSPSYEKDAQGELIRIENYLNRFHGLRNNVVLKEVWMDYRQDVLDTFKQSDPKQSDYFGSSGFDGLHRGERVVLLAELELELFLVDFPEERGKFGYR